MDHNKNITGPKALTSVRQYADVLGRSEMAQALDLGVASISAAIRSGLFPASWWPVLEHLCRERNLHKPPLCLYAVKRPKSDKPCKVLDGEHASQSL